MCVSIRRALAWGLSHAGGKGFFTQGQISEGSEAALASQHHGDRLFRIEPDAANLAEHMGIILCKDIKQVPCLDGMKLHRRRSGKQHALGAESEFVQEGIKPVALGIRIADG
jgi:hypothetical protein